MLHNKRSLGSLKTNWRKLKKNPPDDIDSKAIDTPVFNEAISNIERGEMKNLTTRDFHNNQLHKKA